MSLNTSLSAAGLSGFQWGWTILEKAPSARVAILEKEEGWAQHQTGRNSGVIHSWSPARART